LSFLLQKFTEIAYLKGSETNWSGTSTEIDSLEILKAKIVSSKPFNEQLISAIEAKIIARLVEEYKKEGQLQEQIDERT
jgi:hypothetical protein